MSIIITRRCGVTGGLVLALSLGGAAAFAQERALPAERGASVPHIDKRQDRQAQRIDQASASGGLTEREAQRLDKQQQHVSNVEDKVAADGQVTGKERARVRSAERRASRDIARQSHDKQKPASGQ